MCFEALKMNLKLSKIMYVKSPNSYCFSFNLVCYVVKQISFFLTDNENIVWFDINTQRLK
jgi:hypothetical protein